SALGVAPIQNRQPAADVRLDRVVVPKRQESNRGSEGHNAQLQVLTDFTAVVVDQIEVHAVHGLAVEANAKPTIEKFTQANQIFRADRRAVETTDVKRQRVLDATEVVHKNIVVTP